MRRLAEEKGISPIIATILLIAATAVAAGTIAVYVTGLYVPTARVVAGDIDGTVYDADNTVGEDYTNENVVITIKMTSGYLRDVGDSERGMTVTLSSGFRGWGPFVADVRGQTDYANGYVTKTGVWDVDANTYIHWKLWVPVTADGRFESTAYLYLWADTDDNVANGYTEPARLLWDEGDDLGITVASRGDSFTTTFGTVRLFGRNWIA